ncbi:MFS general substrate transporter [Aspergillus sclerotiicarbonarius CBS 121057]|uniref:MFS general substrate transporter n=1 Tax=Aspergillus sclerotiicarbonarius (strain CBS 121057 / IBT 28362) TaxID=1448318 RepID=A0A319ENL7_ASPSB|nr:MFS general substrate transporter [Aspergillus sclerotiicarbonarius CBS 121057]
MSDGSSSCSVAKTPGPPSDIPNGGFMAWYQVLGSFFLFFNCWGIINTFGVFQTYYEQDLLKSRSAMDISWVGSVQAFLLVFIGVFTGPLFDQGYFRQLIGVGSFLVVFGMMMTSLCHEYWEVMLAQGIVTGLGSGCLFLPSVAILPTYFSTKKALAQGFAASGSSLGGVIYPIVFHKLQPHIGFRWATRVIGFIMLATLVIPNAGMRMRIKPSGRRKMFEAGALREAPFVLFAAGTFFGFMGMYMPFFYVQSYAMEKNFMNDNLAFYLLSITNAASAFGRIVPNFFADRTGPLNMLLPTSIMAGILGFVWISVHNAGGMIVFCIFYGFFSGTFVSLPPTAVVTLSPSLSVVGARMGMNFVIASTGLLIGTPIGGLLLDHGWVALQAWCGACVLMAALFIFLARLTKISRVSYHLRSFYNP